jgi:hypothetical protein
LVEQVAQVEQQETVKTASCRVVVVVEEVLGVEALRVMCV